MGSLSSGAEEERETQREKMCVRFILIIANCLLALSGFCGAKKESQCLLTLYSICVFIILLLQIAAIVFINFDDANISFIKEKISNEAAKIDIEHPEKLTPGSKFVQNLFFGVSAGLAAIILFFTITLCCRARREERVQGYVEAIQA